VPHEKVAASKRTAKLAVAVTRVPKSKRPKAATTTKGAARGKTVASAAAGGAPLPVKAVGKAPSTNMTTTTGRTSKIAATATNSTGPKKITYGTKAPSQALAKPENLGISAGEPAPIKAVTKASPARKVATTNPESKVRKTPRASKRLVEKPAEPSREERQRWIATAAYHRAEKRGFAPGYEVQDWLDAEAEIDELIGRAGLK